MLLLKLCRTQNNTDRDMLAFKYQFKQIHINFLALLVFLTCFDML